MPSSFPFWGCENLPCKSWQEGGDREEAGWERDLGRVTSDSTASLHLGKGPGSGFVTYDGQKSCLLREGLNGDDFSTGPQLSQVLGGSEALPSSLLSPALRTEI